MLHEIFELLCGAIMIYLIYQIMLGVIDVVLLVLTGVYLLIILVSIGITILFFMNL